MADEKPQTKALAPIEEVRRSIVAMHGQFKLALPSHISADKFQRVLMTAVGQNQKLATANRSSLYSACLKAAAEGLLPDGKESALVTFGDQVTYMPMIAGILKKLRNSGELATISAQLVYKKDKFRFYTDTQGEHLEHEASMFEDRGELIGVFAIARTKDNSSYVEVMTKDQVDQVRAASRSKDNGPWVAWYSEMAKKAVLRRLAKRLPSSSDLDSTFEHDNEDYAFDKQVPPTVPELPVGEITVVNKNPSRLEALINEKEPKEEIPPIDPQNEGSPI